MGQLEDLQRNRLARMQNIQKGFCGDDNQDDIFKAHNVGDVHPNHPDWVWTQLPNGKYDWRVRNGQAKPAPTPAPKPSGEPDFTPKIPKEISSLTNRSDWQDFDIAYRTIGAEIFKKKFPTTADFQEWVNDNPYKGINMQQDMERYLGRNYAGDNSGASKTAQIANMKKYYEDKAVKAKRAHQEKKNADYWAGEGAKRKAEIEQERQEQIAIRNKAISDATNEVQTLFGKNTGYTLNVTLNSYGSYKLGVTVDEKRSWDSIELYVERKLSNDFKTELSLGSVRCDYSDPDDVKQAQNLFHCGNLIMQHTNKIKDILIKHGAIVEEVSKKLGELNAELNKNH